MTATTPQRETDLFKALIPWLGREVDTDTGELLTPWDTYGEKTLRLPEQRPLIVDMIAQQRGGEGYIAAYQGKKRLSWDVIEQAAKVRPFVHLCSVVVAHPGRYPSKAHKTLLEACGQKHLGVIYITSAGEVRVERKSPRFDRPDIGPVAEALSIGITLEQEAGRPSPLGARAGRESDRWAKVREYLTAAGEPRNEGEIAVDCDLSPNDRRDFRRMAPKGQIRGVTCNLKAAPYTYEAAL